VFFSGSVGVKIPEKTTIPHITPHFANIATNPPQVNTDLLKTSRKDNYLAER